MTLTSGATVAGRYALGARLGAGGMASVWLAEDAVLGRQVAVKVIADTLAGDDRWLARFEREARAAAAVTHAHVVNVFDYGVEDGSPYLVMEHVPGGSLADRLRDRTPVDVRRLARQLLGALEAVHATGIVHRDVKPANILLDAAGDVRLTDFGIALPEDATALTQTGVVIGTAQFLAPEVLAGAPATPASDRFAAGMVLQAALGERRDPPIEALAAALTDPDPARRPSGRAALAAISDEPAATRVWAPTGPATAVTHALPPVPAAAAPAGPAAPPLVGSPRPRPAAAPGSPYGPQVTIHGRRRPGPPRAARYLLIALAAAVLVVILAFAAASFGDRDGGRLSSPAPADAPVGEQLDRLDELVGEAER